MYLLFDIGASKTRIATSKNYQELDQVEFIPTNFNFTEAINEIKSVVEKLTQGQKIEAAAAGVRALDKDKKSLIDHPRIKLWVREPLYERLLETVDCPLFMENDAAFAALGEATFGAGKDKDIVGYLTISSGIGGCRVTNKKIDQFSSPSEPGSQIVGWDKQPIYLSNLIGGFSLEQKYQKKPQEIDDSEVWDKVAKNLAIGLNNVAALWSPEIIILGGGVMNQINIDQVKSYFSDFFKAFPTPPKIAKSSLDDRSGLYGALAYLNQKNS